MNDNPFPRRGMRQLSVCVFCGSSHGADPDYAATAKKMGELIALNGYALVFGGGNVGLMGEVARAARDGGVPVRGILPEFLKHVEPPLATKEEVIVTPDLQSRKNLMLSIADAFVVLPGGLGTLDEYFEVITSAQLKVFKKPIIVLDAKGYFAPLKTLLEHVAKQGFARPEILTLHHFVPTAEDAVATLNRLLARQLTA